MDRDGTQLLKDVKNSSCSRPALLSDRCGRYLTQQRHCNVMHHKTQRAENQGNEYRVGARDGASEGAEENVAQSEKVDCEEMEPDRCRGLRPSK